MAKKRDPLERFGELESGVIYESMGGRIAARGRAYQEEGRVSDLAVTEDGTLVGRVRGTEEYFTRVFLREYGLVESNCSCPYELDCKHGAAVLFEYLERRDEGESIRRIDAEQGTVSLFDESDPQALDAPVPSSTTLRGFLAKKTQEELVDLIFGLAGRYSRVEEDLLHRIQLKEGDVDALLSHLEREIDEVTEEPGWQNYWQGEGFTPDYSGIRVKLETLLDEGYADESLKVARELYEKGIQQVTISQDQGETAMALASCMPEIVRALESSSIAEADKLEWAIDRILDDPYDLAYDFLEYLEGPHSREVWSELADRLLERLNDAEVSDDTDNFSQRFARDSLSHWVIQALERAGRDQEIIPLCEAEAPRTQSYDRLVDRLIAASRHEEAESWIQKGLQALGREWRGIAANLRDRWKEIRLLEKEWDAVAALEAEEFVRGPSVEQFCTCLKAAEKITATSEVRRHLLSYLQKGELPWEQSDWPLPPSGLDPPKRSERARFPKIDLLIDLAIHEGQPDRVLLWYDRQERGSFYRYGERDDEVAEALEPYAPERAVEIWKKLAEDLIAKVQPKAYREAAPYLRRASAVLLREKKRNEWARYLEQLRETHRRKRRLMQVLDGLEKNLE